MDQKGVLWLGAGLAAGLAGNWLIDRFWKSTVAVAPNEEFKKKRAAFDALPVHQGPTVNSFSTILLLKDAHSRGWKSKTLEGKITMLFAPLPNGDVEEFVIRNSRCELVTASGALFADDKKLTAQLAQHLNIPVPVTIMLDDIEKGRSKLEVAKKFLAEHKVVVVKPTNLGHGDGVTANIRDEKSLEEAISRAQKLSGSIIVQKHHFEPDHRILVVGYKLVAAVKRLPAYVVGDGKHTVMELMEEKNKDPRRGPGHTSVMSYIPVEEVKDFVGEEKLQSIPALGQSVTLLGTANVSRGGESIDVTDIVHPSIREMCERFARGAGMGVCGCDVLCSDISQPAEVSKPVFLELNAGPGLRLHHFPAQGPGRNVAKVILDELLARRIHAKSYIGTVETADKI